MQKDLNEIISIQQDIYINLYANKNSLSHYINKAHR